MAIPVNRVAERPRSHLLVKEEREVQNMAVKKIGENYRCNLCGNEVEVTVAGGGTLVCCGEDMEKIEVASFSQTNLPDS